jgi:hypothetical protein
MYLVIFVIGCFQKETVRFQESAAPRIQSAVMRVFFVETNESIVAVEDADALARSLVASPGRIYGLVGPMPAEYREAGLHILKPIAAIKQVGGEILVHAVMQILPYEYLVIDDLPLEEEALG